MLVMIQVLTIKAFKGVLALVLWGRDPWHVVEHCGETKGIAYVHVSTAEVDITVDDETYHVETRWEPPIVCELQPGRHLLRMIKTGRILFEQEFAIDCGEQVVLTAWDTIDTSRDEQSDSTLSFNPRLAGMRPSPKSP